MYRAATQAGTKMPGSARKERGQSPQTGAKPGATKAGTNRGTLLVAQGDHGIDVSGFAGGDVAGDQGYGDEQ